MATPSDPPERGEVISLGEGPKRRFVLRKGDKTYHVIDPETALMAGNHNKSVGVTIRYKEYYTSGGWRPERGLVPWDGKGGYKGCRMAAAEDAFRRAGLDKMPDWLVREVEKPGFWGSVEFWKRLSEKAKDMMDLDTVRQVMES